MPMRVVDCRITVSEDALREIFDAELRQKGYVDVNVLEILIRVVKDNSFCISTFKEVPDEPRYLNGPYR